MLYFSSPRFRNFKATANLTLAIALFFSLVSAEIAWSLDYKVKHLQSKLTLSGFDPGSIDGFWGKRTASALAEINKKNFITNL